MQNRPMSLLEYCLATAATEGQPDGKQLPADIASIHGAPLIVPEVPAPSIPTTLERAPARHLLRSGSVL